MDQDDLFAAYYTQYRTEADTPNSSDDEYVIFTGLANEAINRWSNYENTFWKELYQTAQLEGDGDLIVVAGTTEYGTPDNMKEAGGYVHLFDDQGVTQVRIPILEPQDAQFKRDNQSYAYFIGDPNNGYTLILNPVPIDSWVGLNINYVYYKKATKFAAGDGGGGANLTEMFDPYFIVHRSLASRFRGSRNPYYTSAKNDAEDVLSTMQMRNNSGTWSDPWSLADNSSGRFGS